MRILPIVITAAAVAAFVAQAAAQEPTTLQYVTTKSVVMKVSGMEIAVTYTPDGKFTAMNGAITGAYRIVGDKMCSTNNMEPAEACVVYPAGKKPGDEFEVVGPQGPFVIKINK
jgi:roadblock/LC7 domain-containing protein